MSKVAINEITLTNIGDAIREKTGKTDLIAPGDMPAEIASISTGGGGGVEIEPIVLSGNCSRYGTGLLSAKCIEVFGDKITTNNLGNISYMFKDYLLTNIPFELNMSGMTYYSCDNLFNGASKLKALPIMNNFYPSTMQAFCKDCYRLRTIPEEAINNWNYSELKSYDWGSLNEIFCYCYSLRNIPESFLKNLYGRSTSYYNNLFYRGFYYCFSLDEIRGLNFSPDVTMTSNLFNNTFDYCERVKDIIFDCNEDGSPKIIRATSQTIDLTNKIGSAASSRDILNYNSGITADKQVTDDATYQALKDDPDWWTTDSAYCRYNHDSAVRTINSLPDTSAYLASDGGTNTIKFRGASGGKTDGGAINTLTEEEIAVATAKGWTVTLV